MKKQVYIIRELFTNLRKEHKSRILSWANNNPLCFESAEKAHKYISDRVGEFKIDQIELPAAQVVYFRR